MLQPIPNTQNVSGGETPNAVEYLQRVYYFALTAAVILAILMLVIAGAEYTAAGVSPSAKEDAKKRIMYALGGLLLALLSWLILNTINPDILKTNLGISKIPGSTPNLGTSVNNDGSPGLTSEILRRLLEANCVGIKDSSVSLDGVGNDAIQGVVLLGRLVGDSSTVLITSGTDGSHNTHGYGESTIDLSSKTGLNIFFQQEIAAGRAELLEGGYTPNGNFSDSAIVKYYNGTYEYEGSAQSSGFTAPHFHATYSSISSESLLQAIQNRDKCSSTPTVGPNTTPTD